MAPLKNPKHELFCQQLALGKSASEAFVLAGFAPSSGNACVLKAKQSVSDRLNELLRESEKTVLETIEITRETILRELEDARKQAKDLQMPGAAWQASMAKARILGLIVDRREVGEAGAFDSHTDEELIAEAAQKAKTLGVAGPKLVKTGTDG